MIHVKRVGTNGPLMSEVHPILIVGDVTRRHGTQKRSPIYQIRDMTRPIVLAYESVLHKVNAMDRWPTGQAPL